MKCCDLHSGMLRITMVLEAREDPQPDGFGGTLSEWGEVATVRAYLKPLSAREREWAQRVESNVTHRAWIRYRAGVTGAMRAKVGTRVFSMLPPINVEERSQWLELNLIEGAAT